MKCLRVTKLVKEIKFEGVWDDLEAKNVSKDNHSQNIWDWPWFSCEIAHYRKGLVPVFGEFVASTEEMLILTGGLGTRLSFYGV